MDFRLEDYIKFYWAVYYNVRAEYFPNDSWRKEFNDKSPEMWSSDIIGKRSTLGRELFGRATKYIYLNLTYYSERQTSVIPVDDGFIILAFKKIGLEVSEQERIDKKLTSEDVPEILINRLREEYHRYLDQYPDLSKTISATLKKIIEKLGINYQPENPKFKNEAQTSKSKTKALTQSENRAGENNNHIEEEVKRVIYQFYQYINDEEHRKISRKEAYDMFSSKWKEISFINSDLLFLSAYKWTKKISNIHIWDIAQKEFTYTCKVYLEETICSSILDTWQWLQSNDETKKETFTSLKDKISIIYGITDKIKIPHYDSSSLLGNWLSRSMEESEMVLNQPKVLTFSRMYQFTLSVNFEGNLKISALHPLANL